MKYKSFRINKWVVNGGLLLTLFTCSSFFSPKIGDVIDMLDGIKVHYNGSSFARSYGRNLATDGYNLGLKYQCVEFVKRYYYYHFDHKMPDTGGNARNFLTKLCLTKLTIKKEV
ncbi:MAG: hypothetical protein IPN29_00645 [Saprospiraceae bacterium]|nr:hypothetical protein [Saprospiraceae bacterium]